MPEGFADDGDVPGAPPATEVAEVTTSDAFKQHCTDLTGLCIIAALNPAAADFASHQTTFQVQISSLNFRAVLCML